MKNLSSFSGFSVRKNRVLAAILALVMIAAVCFVPNKSVSAAEGDSQKTFYYIKFYTQQSAGFYMTDPLDDQIVYANIGEKVSFDAPAVWNTCYLNKEKSVLSGVVKEAVMNEDENGKITFDSLVLEAYYDIEKPADPTDPPVVDNTKPVVKVTGDSSNIFVGQTREFVISATDDSKVTLDTSKLATSSDSIKVVSSNVNGNNCTVKVQFVKAGNSSLAVNQGFAKDAFGNESEKVAINFSAKENDTTKPVVKVSGETGNIIVGQTRDYVISVTDNSAVKLDTSKLSVTSDNVKIVSSNVNGNSCTVKVQFVKAGNSSLNVNQGFAKDAFGNESEKAAVNFSAKENDTTKPTVNISGTTNAFKVGESREYIISVNDASAVTIDSSKIALSTDNAKMTVVTDTKNNMCKVTIQFVKAGQSNLCIAQGFAKDSFGNESEKTEVNLAAEEEEKPPVVDNVKPSVKVTGDSNNIFVGQTREFVFTVTDESKVTLDTSKLAASSDSIKIVSSNVNGNDYTVKVQFVKAGNSSLTVNQGFAKDVFGNESEKVTVNFSAKEVVTDNVKPSVKVTGNTSNIYTGQTREFVVTVTDNSKFSMDSNKFSVSSGNVQIVSKQYVNANTYKIKVKFVKAGNSSLYVNQGFAKDVYGNQSDKVTFNFSVKEGNKPVVKFSGKTSKIHDGQTITYYVTISDESKVSLDRKKITVSASSKYLKVSTSYVSSNKIKVVINYKKAGNYKIYLNSGLAKDAYGNTSNKQTIKVKVDKYDRTAPKIKVSGKTSKLHRWYTRTYTINISDESSVKYYTSKIKVTPSKNVKVKIYKSSSKKLYVKITFKKTGTVKLTFDKGFAKDKNGNQSSKYTKSFKVYR